LGNASKAVRSPSFEADLCQQRFSKNRASRVEIIGRNNGTDATELHATGGIRIAPESNPIVAVDSRKRRDGRYIEQLGTYDPLLEGTNFTIDLAIADKWLAVGAKPSETVNSMIRKARTAAAKA